MNGYKVVLRNKHSRLDACRLIWAAPIGASVSIAKQVRTLPQNSRMWAMLTEVALAEPEGRKHTPEVWKMLFMHSLGHQARFEIGLNGEPFPTGFRSSRLTKEQMSDLIEVIYEYGSRHGVRFGDLEQPETDEDDGGRESEGSCVHAQG